VLQQRIVGSQHLKLLLQIPGTFAAIDAVFFKAIDHPVAQQNWLNKAVRAAFRLDVNEFRNRRQLQLIVEHCEMV